LIKANDVPRYIQAREALRDQIQLGQLEPGEKLPSEDQLAAQFGVSRMTMRKSLNGLIDAGLLYRRHGVGTFVTQSRVQRDHTRLTDFFENCRQSGRTPKAQVLYKEVIPANEEIAEALRLAPGEELIHIGTLRFVDDEPITFHDAYLPARLFPHLVSQKANELKLESQHVWQLIEQRGFNLTNVVERLEAQPATNEISSLLRIHEGAPILYGERVLYADDGTPLKYADCYNRGDRFSLTVILTR
jgi:GntR family transcriptional regulator